MLHLSQVLRKHKFSEKLLVHLTDTDMEETHALLNNPGQLKTKIRALRKTYEPKRKFFSPKKWWKMLKMKKVAESRPVHTQKDFDFEIPESYSGELHKVFLLGVTHAGKSTMCKCLKAFHGTDYKSVDDRNSYFYLAEPNIMKFAKELVDQYIDVESTNDVVKLELNQSCCDAAAWLRSLSHLYLYTINDCELDVLKKLWANAEIRKCVENYSFDLGGGYTDNGNFSYLLDKIDDVVDPRYEPSIEDIVRMHVRTAGCQLSQLKFKDRVMQIYDFGGSRCDHRHWHTPLRLSAHPFTAVIYHASLSSYDEKSFDDESENAMADSLNIFELLVEHWKPIKDATLIVLLTKAEVFKYKLRRVSLKVCFPDYDGPNTYEHALSFIKKKFLERARANDIRFFVIDFFASFEEETPATISSVLDCIVASGSVLQCKDGVICE